MNSIDRRGSGETVATILNSYRNLRWWWRYLILSTLASCVLLALAGASVAAYYSYLAHRENLGDLGKMPQRSIVYDRTGNVIGRLHGSNRVVVSIDDVSPLFIDALIAREDSRFFRHHGIDYFGVLRSLLRNIADREIVQGASTITMQLSRNSYFGHEKTLHRKLLEVMMARRIEARYSKREILNHYVNRIYFGAGLYGVERASQAYFHKTPKEISLGEAALLAGIIRAPSRLSPVKHYDAALRERDTVLQRMLNEKLVSIEEVEQARAEKIVVYHVDPALEQNSYALDAVRRDLDLFLEESEVEDGGFEIHTTLDLRLQAAAQTALESRLLELETTPGYPHPTKADFENTFVPGTPASTNYVQGAVVVIDNETGAIAAVVGGRDFAHNKYNRALLARRQIGSAFKPFVYATALQQGLMPGTLIDDSQIRPGELPSSPGRWSPRNSDNTYHGMQPLEWGLIKSRNTMSVRVGSAIGIDSTIRTVQALQLATNPERSPQLFIGNLGATLKALTSAYSAFPNGGILKRPFIISRIEKIGGGVLRATPIVETPTFSPGAAWMTSDILRKVVDQGTAARVRQMGFASPAGGKTGTTNDYTDAWFVGYTSRLSTGVWVGLDNPKTIVDRGYGSRLALPVWVDVMQAAESTGYPGASLLPPLPFATVELCRITGLLAGDACRRADHAYPQSLPYEMIPHVTCAYHPTQFAKPARQPDRPRKGLFKRIFSLFH